ncbi:MAG: hypothetical protein H0X26_03785 [Alphaproteobacteria bacterium]|nr:hypothetical protein [Alphaproteobacteria bacterium]
MKTLKIAIFVLLPMSFSLCGCGLKKRPLPAEGSEITYRGPYPNPELCE